MKFDRDYIGKKKHFVINGLIVIVLLVTIVNQMVWLGNMYNLFYREYKANIDKALQNSTFMEFAERAEIMGGFSVYASNMTAPNDTSRYFSKKIATADSIYTFTLDKNDPNTLHKISQFILKKHLPINLNRLTAVFRENIDKSYEVEEAYFDYLDLANDTVIKTTRPESFTFSRYVMTDTVPMDIIDSIGVVGYVSNGRSAILDNMKRQLLLSMLLILVGMVSLFYISRSFIFQWKTEKMRQDSVNVITHEFKRPISNAVAMTSVIPFYLEKKDMAKVLGYVEKIQIALNKLTYYTKRIQQISNNEKSNFLLDKSAIEIIPFFKSLQQQYTSEKREQEIIINLDIATSKNEMHVDLLHFSNVMDNLIENSIKYTIAPTVVIDLSVEDTAGGYLKISVKDNGIGISSADKKFVFDKFYRVKREETKNRVGFGLGLTYVKSVVEAHGGEIDVESKLNEGSTFVVIL